MDAVAGQEFNVMPSIFFIYRRHSDWTRNPSLSSSDVIKLTIVFVVFDVNNVDEPHLMRHQSSPSDASTVLDNLDDLAASFNLDTTKNL